MVSGIVIQFRRSRRNYQPRHFLIEVKGINSREKAGKLVGKEVFWKSPGKEPKVLSGKISSAHGNKGVVRAIFETGLPGQAIGTECEVEGFASPQNKAKKSGDANPEVKA